MNDTKKKEDNYMVWLEAGGWKALPLSGMSQAEIYAESGGNYYGSRPLSSPEEAIEEAQAYYKENEIVPEANEKEDDYLSRYLWAGGGRGMERRPSSSNRMSSPLKWEETITEDTATSYEYKGFTGELDLESLHGRVLNIKDTVNFRPQTAEEGRKEFEASIDDYLEFVAELREEGGEEICRDS